MDTNYIEWDTIGLCGIAGKSGSGKSSTMRLLLAQMAMRGIGLIVADGHGHFGQQSIAPTITTLEPAMVFPVAVEDGEIYRSIEAAYNIALWRTKNWSDTHDPPRIALVVDEITSIIGRLDSTRAQFIIKALNFFATEARKTNVKTFIASQNWTQDFIGAASIRKNMNTLILHRTAPDEVVKFTNMPVIKRSVPNMRVGEAWIISGNTDPVKVYLPRVTQDDIISVAHLIPPYEMTDDVSSAIYGSEIIVKDREISESRNTIISAPQSVISGISNPSIDAELLQKWYREIVKYDTLRYNKADTIYRIWGAMPGATKKYKVASKIYDYLKAKMP